MSNPENTTAPDNTKPQEQEPQPPVQSVDDIMDPDLGKPNPKGRPSAWQKRQSKLAEAARDNVQALLDDFEQLHRLNLVAADTIDRLAEEAAQLREERDRLEATLQKADLQHSIVQRERTILMQACSAAASRWRGQLQELAGEEGQSTLGFNEAGDGLTVTVYNWLGQFTAYFTYVDSAVHGHFESMPANERRIRSIALDADGMNPDDEQLFARLVGAPDGAMSARAREAFCPQPRKDNTVTLKVAVDTFTGKGSVTIAQTHTPWVSANQLPAH